MKKAEFFNYSLRIVAAIAKQRQAVETADNGKSKPQKPRKATKRGSKCKTISRTA